jgi:Iodothyronine deiodinase
VARHCCQTLDLSIPTAVDDMSDTVNQLYKAWPERLYVIDRGGKIAYKSAIGPWGFRPDEAGRALRKLLKATPARNKL